MKKGIDYIGVGVGAIILNKQNQIFLTKRSKKTRNEKGKWELPGGGVDFGEKIKEALKREIYEEFGIKIKVGELVGVFDHLIPDEKQHWVSSAFLCTIIKGEPKIREPEKCEEIGWFSISDAQKMQLSIISIENLKVFKSKFRRNQ